MAWLALLFPPDAPPTALDAARARRFTPQVSLATATPGQDALLLDLAGCTTLFGGLPRLLAQLDAAFAARIAGHGLGHTPWAALRLGWHGVDARTAFDTQGNADATTLQRLLAALPVAGPGLADDDARALQRMGLATLGALQALPVAALQRRFGKGLVDWLARLSGSRPDPRAALAPPESFSAGRELSFGSTQAAPLLPLAAQLLAELAAFLRARQLATQRIDWHFTHADRSHSTLAVVTTRAQTGEARLLALTQVRLETFRPAAAVEAISLHCRQLLPLSALPDTLFPALAAQQQRDEAVLDLLDRLRTRLGDEACRRWIAVDRHRPEAAQRALAGAAAAGNDGSAVALQLPAAPRPRWLLPQPARIAQRGPTLHWQGALVLLGSVERLQAEWWDQPFARDYWCAQREDGVLLWIFHDHADRHWYVHGVFG